MPRGGLPRLCWRSRWRRVCWRVGFRWAFRSWRFFCWPGRTQLDGRPLHAQPHAGPRGPLAPFFITGIGGVLTLTVMFRRVAVRRPAPQLDRRRLAYGHRRLEYAAGAVDRHAGLDCAAGRIRGVTGRRWRRWCWCLSPWLGNGRSAGTWGWSTCIPWWRCGFSIASTAASGCVSAPDRCVLCVLPCLLGSAVVAAGPFAFAARRRSALSLRIAEHAGAGLRRASPATCWWPPTCILVMSTTACGRR